MFGIKIGGGKRYKNLFGILCWRILKIVSCASEKQRGCPENKAEQNGEKRPSLFWFVVEQFAESSDQFALFVKSYIQSDRRFHISAYHRENGLSVGIATIRV